MESNLFADVDMYASAFFGAFALYVLNRINDKPVFSFLSAINIKINSSSWPGTIVFDMIISSALGSFIVVNMTIPETIPQAIIAGLGMTGIFSSYSKPSN